MIWKRVDYLTTLGALSSLWTIGSKRDVDSDLTWDVCTYKSKSRVTNRVLAGGSQVTF